MAAMAIGIGVFAVFLDSLRRGRLEVEIYPDRLLLRYRNLFNSQEAIAYPTDIDKVEECTRDGKLEGLLVTRIGFPSQFLVPVQVANYEGISLRLRQWGKYVPATA